VQKLRAPLFLICLVVSLTAAAADFWAKKPYQSWSAEETQNMLENSPWATMLKLSGVQNIAGNGPNARAEMEDDPNITYTIQFRSAVPIRQAQVRSAQLSSHYDKMSAEQKAAFDANTGKFLNATFPDRIIIAVTFQSNVQNYQSELRTYWTEQSVPKLSMKVFLNTGAERLSLTNYNFKDDTFQFTFPRPKELPPDGKISLEFVHPRIERISEQRIFQVFSLKKMLVEGQPAL
jgi:hypothetical protein